MSDYGEFCREQKRSRRRARETQTIVCPTCGDDDGKRVWLGDSCDRCGIKIDHEGRIIREEKK